MTVSRTAALTTGRLVLTPLRPDDADEMVHLLASEELYAFIGGAPLTLEQLRARYEAQVAGPPGPEQVWHNWVIRLRQTARAVGFVQATVTGEAADVAWLVGVAWQGQGLAGEAAAAMCAWLGECGVSSVAAHIHPEHVASERVAEAAGLASTGNVDSDGEVIWAMRMT
jgi:RimJ/RimL family protein N-acetyltransferase